MWTNKELFTGKAGEKPGNPIYTQEVGEGGGDDIQDKVQDMLGKRNKGLMKNFKKLSDLAGGKKTKVGRMLRRGAALAGKRGGMAANILGKGGGIAGKLGGLGKGLGKLAAGGGIGAIVGIAAEQSLGVFQRRAEAAAGARRTDGAAVNPRVLRLRGRPVAAAIGLPAGVGAVSSRGRSPPPGVTRSWRAA